MNLKKHFYIFILLFSVFTSAYSEYILLDFEGLQNLEAIEDFYNGGSGSRGSIPNQPKNYGITFSSDALVIIDADNGGSGNFANEPSPNTIMFFLDYSNNDVIMNVQDGWYGGLSFFYTTLNPGGRVEIYTDYDGKGKLITSVDLEITPHEGKGDPTGYFDNWKRVSINFEGRAKSVVFKGAANKIAFDNILLGSNAPQDVKLPTNLSIDGLSEVKEFEKEPGFIRHGGYETADKFEIVLNIHSSKNYKNLCDKVKTFVVTGDKKSEKILAEQSFCHVNKEFFRNKYTWILGFTIKNNPPYFENGVLKICSIKNSDKCAYADKILGKFSVYGTYFDLRKHSFKFKNGSWNKARFTKENRLLNNIAHIADVIDDYIEDQEESNVFWDSIGWTEERPLWRDPSHDSEGLCSGMANVSASLYNSEQLCDQDNNYCSTWGDDWTDNKFDKNIWENDIISHWNNTEKEVNPPYRAIEPLNNNGIYNYDANDFRSFEKIAYYFVTHPYFSKNKWVGSQDIYWVFSPEECRDSQRCRNSKLNDFIKGVKNYFKRNLVTPLGFSWRRGAHRITLVQMIEYVQNGAKVLKLINYDNNYPYPENRYLTLYIYNIDYNQNLNYQEDINFYLYKKGKKYSYNLTTINTLKASPLHVLSKEIQSASKKIVKISKQENQNPNPTIDYLYPNHILVYIVGGTLENVRNIDGAKIRLLAYTPNMHIEKNKAYKLESNLFKNVLLLPVDEKYEVEVRKNKNFPFLKIFTYTPYPNGLIKSRYYDHAEISEKDSTLVSFFVGRDVQQHELLRIDENGNTHSSIQPTHERNYVLPVLPVNNLKGSVIGNTVKLEWENPDILSYKETIIVRRENEPPFTLDDGIQIYKGNSERIVDNSIELGKTYYYAAFVKDTNDKISNPTFVQIDTYKYSIYGYIKDENNQPVRNAVINLYTKDGNTLIKSDYSDKEGYFSLNGLLDGEYTLKFEHPLYIFNPKIKIVSIDGGSTQVVVNAVGKPKIELDVPSQIEEDSSVVISWNGVHIPSNSNINIEILKEGSVIKTIAQNIPFDSFEYIWVVSDLESLFTDYQSQVLTLRITLANNSNVYSEKEIVIIPIKKYLLKVKAVGKGELKINPISNKKCGIDCYIYKDGKTVTLTAVPFGEAYLLTWTGDCRDCKDNKTCTIQMNSNKECKAIFKVNLFSEQINKSGGGCSFSINQTYNILNVLIILILLVFFIYKKKKFNPKN